MVAVGVDLSIASVLARNRNFIMIEVYFYA
jgi:hypothetical protein